MVEHICQKCGKVFTHKNTYNNHMKRKKPCNINITEIIETTKTMETIETIEKDYKYETLIQKIKELEEKIVVLQKQSNVTNNNIDNSINNAANITNNNINNSTNNTLNITNDNSIKNNVNIIVMTKPFGEENLSFIDDKISKKILARGYGSLPEYIKIVHFNKSVPENHNVYIPNWRDKTMVLVYDGINWNLEQTKLIMDDIKIKGIEFIQKKYNELDPNNQKDSVIIKKLKRFLESYEAEEKDKIDILNKDMQLVLYNNRQISEETKKKQKNKNKI